MKRTLALIALISLTASIPPAYAAKSPELAQLTAEVKARQQELKTLRASNAGRRDAKAVAKKQEQLRKLNERLAAERAKSGA